MPSSNAVPASVRQARAEAILVNQERVERYNARQNAHNRLVALNSYGIELYESYTIATALNNVATFGSGAAAAYAQGIMKVLDSLINTSSGSFVNMFNEVGQEAMVATLEKYANRSNNNRGGRKNSGYRAGAAEPYTRDAGGKLYAALSSSRMWSAEKNGILFINRTHLDQYARQWYRLNFGAGPRATTGRKHQRYRVRIFGQNAGRVSLNSYRPSPRFLMPAGFWSKDGGLNPIAPSEGRRNRDVFVPLGYLKKRLDEGARSVDRLGGTEEATFDKSRNALQVKRNSLLRSREGMISAMPKRYSQGIAATAYLDAGINRISKAAPLGTQRLLQQLALKAIKEGDGSPQATRFARAFDAVGPELDLKLSEFSKFLDAQIRDIARDRDRQILSAAQLFPAGGRPR